MAVIIKSNEDVEIAKSIKVDNVQVGQVRTIVNTDNPENVSLTHYISNQTLYKAGYTEIGAVEAKVEDEVYTGQDAIITELTGGNRDAA